MLLIGPLLLICVCRSSIWRKEKSSISLTLRSPAVMLASETRTANANFTKVREMAKDLLVGSFAAGSSYAEIWIRDSATFIDVALEVNDPSYIRRALLPFFSVQAENGAMPDAYVNDTAALEEYPVHAKGDWPICDGHSVVCKNSVETDQETSLILAVHSYVRGTNETAFLSETVKGQTVLDRLELSVRYLLSEMRDVNGTGLLFGATTIDWGDIQPEESPGAKISSLSHRAVDVYDNSMFILALDALADLCAAVPAADSESEKSRGSESDRASKWRAMAVRWRSLTREHLWDSSGSRFIPHLYLSEGSPFPDSFDESRIYFHGGTAVAALAGVLSSEEVLKSYEQMSRNVEAVRAAGGAVAIGMTVYPPYPAGLFVNPSVAVEFSYQNAGDWDWFGGRMVQALVVHKHCKEALEALQMMCDRVVKFDGFFEWFDFDGKPSGSAKFKGSAGALGKAVEMMTSSHSRCADMRTATRIHTYADDTKIETE
uniref:Alpha,alpha-trehalase n=1 Tax=Chromera velia CCMP2878 TaxID=1169474 RepID=A0A0G4FK48_9ALVE|eukprot:Cvel_17444.t1-p1 / transcript=Cvel_17444.t1 / gene=Cvel_17444 / organism=Chromera_velia_CCMP2878 / gene_product=hypothetical protein / transcript_product=hypothetical protein / location=Cvel_scaffold1392:10896-12356(+) / protein_length=487 / sequence_SO=supercontig / SO=protein_coding / is_pseudo=false